MNSFDGQNWSPRCTDVPDVGCPRRHGDASLFDGLEPELDKPDRGVDHETERESHKQLGPVQPSIAELATQYLPAII